ncbi:TPA: hypothetical protein ACGTY9_004192 [Klebsiella pneumoniae]
MNIETVNELIQSLESAGELSIREQKFLKLAKAFKQLAAENVALKESRNNLAEFIHEELDADYPLNMNLETHATDRIVAGIKADGVDIIRNALIKFVEDEVGRNDLVPGLIRGAEVCVSVADSLREGADK